MSDSVRAEGSNRHFFHTLVTDASPESIWERWMDVQSWSSWDTELTSSQCEEPLQVGVRGTLVADGRTLPFEVTAMDPGRTYTYLTPLPLGGLHVTRTVSTEGGKTTFTHDVRLSGLGGWLLSPMLGRRFRSVLPRVMSTLDSVARTA